MAKPLHITDRSPFDENNNTLEGGTLADLTVSDFKVYYPTTGPYAGAGHRIRFTVTNTGFDAGRFLWEVSVLRSGKWGSVFGQRISGVASGQSVQVDVPAASFASLAGAAAILTVDALNEIPETNENNNRSMLTNVERPPLK
jgi:subtilase family serine protease